MYTLRTISVAIAAVAVLSACAQFPARYSAHPPAASAPDPRIAMMDTHMESMREMHAKMMNARTPEERNALGAEHMKLMHDGMSMMGGCR